MAKFEVFTGEVFQVEANSEDEALAKFYVSQGYRVAEDYSEAEQASFTNLDEDVSFLEVDTRVIL